MPTKSINWHAINAASDHGFLAHGDNPKFRSMRIKFRVPLAHNDPQCNETIQLHAELVYGHGQSQTKYDLSDGGLVKSLGSLTSPRCPDSSSTLAVYLCGGPGSDNPAFAHEELTRNLLDRIKTPVLYLDYRGTVSKKADAQLSEYRITNSSFKGLSSKQVAQRLMLYRQDSIVADFEAVRLCLNKLSQRDIKFALVGQSFGGWIAMTYLSFLPKSLARVWITGGMPPIGKTPEVVYKALFERVAHMNELYYNEYPKDKDNVWKIVKFLANEDGGNGIRLPNGQRLTARGGEAGFKKVHAHVEGLATKGKNYKGLNSEDITGFKLTERPLYAVLHESIYCCGPGVASKWAAQRVGRGIPEKFSWLKETFDFTAGSLGKLYFSGEMIYDFMLRDADLTGLVEPSEILAEIEDWPELYDTNALKENPVPLTALIYPKDMYVDVKLSWETVKTIVPSCVAIRAPDAWPHNNVKIKATDVFDVLIDGKLQKHSATLLQTL
ncbi:hypothetical protein F5144DRAFT_661109 [Chaetomium tenue]|uniref:Uncharacterized protein n=1 Tax=Chaetomium tenue TaxID=1854479 RepID=A0ACB7NXX5_9PEZI|nr:hypothetical protein F5144DRAFT_661109 [Chaetomium globosum]